MAKPNLTSLEEKELVQLQIDLSNKRAAAQADYTAQQLAVQDELDRRALDRRLGDLTPAQVEYLREKVNKKEQADG